MKKETNSFVYFEALVRGTQLENRVEFVWPFFVWKLLLLTYEYDNLLKVKFMNSNDTHLEAVEVTVSGDLPVELQVI